MPFSNPDRLFELKLDGCRALAYVSDGRCELVSRKGITYQRSGELAESIAIEVQGDTAVLDG